MRIAIVGGGSNKHRAPFEEPGWHIWTLSPRNRGLPRHDVWFELHAWDHIKGLGVDYTAYLRTLPFIYMREEVCCHFPGARPYPKDEMLAEFGSWFFERSSLPWIAAKAITRLRKVPPGEERMLGWWGITTDTPEYAAQWPEVRHFNQIARDSRIELLAPGSKILDPLPLYHEWE